MALTRDAIERGVEQRLADNVALFQRLLRIPTPRGAEHAAMELVQSQLTAAGCQPIAFAGTICDATGGWPRESGPNLFATRPGSGNGHARSLLLAAHIDTVPPGDEEMWRIGPWSGEIQDGRLFGRGAHDDRGGVALLCMLAQLLHELGAESAGNLHFLVTSQEEYDVGGMRAFLSQPFCVTPDAALLVDGTGTADCIHAHPSCLVARVRFSGAARTVQGADAGDNPIVRMSRFVGRLRLLADETWAGTRGAASASAIAAPTAVRSSGWMSNSPEWCEVDVFANMPAGVAFEDWREKCEALTDASVTTTLGPLGVPAMETPRDSPLFQALSDARSAGFDDGVELQQRRVSGWGDIGLLGAPDTLFFGPGVGGAAHGYDEYYEIDSLAPMLKTLAHLVRIWCSQENAR